LQPGNLCAQFPFQHAGILLIISYIGFAGEGVDMKRAETPQIKITKRKSPAGGKQQGGDSPFQLGDHQDLIALIERISRLEAENKGLREQIATLTSTANRPVQPYTDSVREQQHNFFKYSDIRRY
jgi:hypothetical protein